MNNATHSPYPFEPFLAMMPLEAGNFFMDIAMLMYGEYRGAASTARAGEPARQERHLVDLHNLARMGALGIWQHVDQEALSPESRAFIQRCDAACSRYAQLTGEALQWWKNSIDDPEVRHSREVTSSFRTRYPGFGWAQGSSVDDVGFLNVLRWYAGGALDDIPWPSDVLALKHAQRDVPEATSREILALEEELLELTGLLNEGRCPLSGEAAIPFDYPEGNPIIIPNQRNLLLNLYCLNQTGRGLNDSRHHHPVLIAALKDRTAEGKDSAVKLGHLDEDMATACRMEDYRAMMRIIAPDAQGMQNAFASHKVRALGVFQSLPHTAEGGLDYDLFFSLAVESTPERSAWLDWLLLGKMMDEHMALPDFLKPLHAYMETLRPMEQERGFE
ncbi:hypothetical protein GC177_02825 [bacterium]|nr:hypothetical protein [bacterium]